ncbi:4Fe-4S cluster-binding domain-containing protein [Anaeroselena agilis]|uniref:4Fe-4S cluster-binding domain-containing protein n=1 Tax=Anaeroselena agilis TaxID=3063788 RepID=A0ABU3NVQ8_9FIRM|nr:4Fe-4S cluster-binding domain-containing protein [Selenomonadales bacterium 4137-cl]
MRLAGVVPEVVTCYPAMATEVFFQGCDRGCKDCHNPSLLPFDGGEEWGIEQVVNAIDDWSGVISLTGGDPLRQGADCKALALRLRECYPGKQLWLFTGEVPERLPLWVYRVFDVIKTGPYIYYLATGGFPASSNQQLLQRGVHY